MAPAATAPKSSSKKAPSSKANKHHPSSGGSIHNNNNHNNNTAAGEYLLERLRILLNRLQSTTEILQNWPETQGDSAKIHADTATALIASIRKIVVGLRVVEQHVNGTTDANGGGGGGSSNNNNMSKEALEAFRTSLEDKCPIPLDVLDLLDVGQPCGLNPQCYARGLMKESMRQLGGLERRKSALAMLAKSIEEGMDARMTIVRKRKGGGGGGGGATKETEEVANDANDDDDDDDGTMQINNIGTEEKKGGNRSVENTSKRKREEHSEEPAETTESAAKMHKPD